jgi:hypothetical protein
LVDPTGAEGRLYADVAGDMGSDSPVVIMVMITKKINIAMKMIVVYCYPVQCHIYDLMVMMLISHNKRMILLVIHINDNN